MKKKSLLVLGATRFARKAKRNFLIAGTISLALGYGVGKYQAGLVDGSFEPVEEAAVEKITETVPLPYTSGEGLRTNVEKTELDKMMFDPRSETFEQDVRKVMPQLFAHMIQTEGYFHKLYFDGGGTLTAGVGFAVGSDHIENRKEFRKITNNKTIAKGTVLTKEEIYELFDWYTSKKIVVKMKEDLEKPIDYRVLVGVVIAMYNRGDSILRTVRDKKGNLVRNDGVTLREAINQSGTPGNTRGNVLQAYLELMKPKDVGNNNGLRKKYRLLVDYMNYQITDDEVFSSVAGGKYRVFWKVQDAKIKYGGDRGTLPIAIDPISNIASRLLTVNPKVEKGERQDVVYTYLPQEWHQSLRAGEIMDSQVAQLIAPPREPTEQEIKDQARKIDQCLGLTIFNNTQGEIKKAREKRDGFYRELNAARKNGVQTQQFFDDTRNTVIDNKYQFLKNINHECFTME